LPEVSTYLRTAKPQAAVACRLAPNPDLERFWDKALIVAVDRL